MQVGLNSLKNVDQTSKEEKLNSKPEEKAPNWLSQFFKERVLNPDEQKEEREVVVRHIMDVKKGVSQEVAEAEYDYFY